MNNTGFSERIEITPILDLGLLNPMMRLAGAIQCSIRLCHRSSTQSSAS